MVTDANLGLLREELAPKGSGKHGGVNLFAVRNQCVACEWVVVLPARQLTDPPDSAVNRPQTRAVALPPDHPFVVGRRRLAPALHQRAVGVEEQLCVENGSAVAF